MKYALDTNTVIYLMRGTPSVQENRKKVRKSNSQLVIPPFVHYEVRRGLKIKPVPRHEAAYRVICDNCLSGAMTIQVWERAAEIYAELYSKRLTVSDSDIIIAAFCLENGCTLVTNNTKDFENISGLQITDWASE
ncbi:MAG: PIN domain-containing protein [Oscillospiraceae bacterium]|nr:PIN domain-containing protein [Oscillospiraceae bacterium]